MTECNNEKEDSESENPRNQENISKSQKIDEYKTTVYLTYDQLLPVSKP